MDQTNHVNPQTETARGRYIREQMEATGKTRDQVLKEIIEAGNQMPAKAGEQPKPKKKRTARARNRSKPKIPKGTKSAGK